MRALVVLAVLLGAVLLGAARATAGSLAEANQDYLEKRYEAAIEKYERLLAEGNRHETLFYDLGNAYFQAGRYGPAILNYERALRMAPDAEDVEYNLGVARERVAQRLGRDTIEGAEKDPLWIRVVTWLPLSPLTWGFLALDAVFFLVLVGVWFLPNGFLRTGLVAGNVFVAVAVTILGALLAGQVYFRNSVRMSVVVADEVVMREGPDPTRREMPKLHAGHRVIVLKESQGWYRIRLANKMEGWVPRESVTEI